MRYTQHRKNTPNRLTLAVVSLLSAMALTACGGGGGGDSNTPTSTGGRQSANNGGNIGGGSGNNPTPTQPVINELVVTTLNDVVNDKDDVNSLREAIIYANQNGGTITFKDDLKGTITLSKSIDINKSPNPFIIKGKGDDIKIDGNNTVRLFHIKDSTITFDNIVLQNANIPSNNPYDYGGGAAIHATETNLNLNNVKLLNNESLKDSGGAIYTKDGTLNIIGGEFTKNTGANGGAIHSQDNSFVTINGTKFDNNKCESTVTNRCYGGAISHLGRNIDIINATFDNNTGGTVANSNKKTESMGGAIYFDLNHGLTQADKDKAGNATITGSKFNNNLAGVSGAGKSSWGGAIVITSYLYKQPNYTVTIKGSEFEDNISAHGSGGAIYMSLGNTLNITDSKFSNNQAQQAKDNSSSGGAIRIGAGSLSVKNSSFTGNKAMGSVLGTGGAIDAGTAVKPVYTFNIDNTTFKNNYSRKHGGAVALTSGYKSAIISNSTFEDNRANSSHLGEGGGLYAFGSDVKVTDSSFTGNHSHYGGGAYVVTQSADLENVIFKNNSVTLTGGGLFYQSGTKKMLTIKDVTTLGNTSSAKVKNKGEGIYCQYCKNKVNNLGGNNFGDPNVGM